MPKKINEYFVTVRFHKIKEDSFSSDDYCYWIKTAKEIKTGDYIILKDNETNWDQLKVCKVIDIETRKKGKTYESARTKGFIGFADIGDYFAAKEKKIRVKTILKNLEERFKQSEKMQLYRKLAEQDGKMQALLNELDALGYDCEEDSDECTE